MDRLNIDKIAQNCEDRMLLAKIWDKINSGIRRNIAANTAFLSPRELEMARLLLGESEGLYRFGGYGDAERRMLVYLPEYLAEDRLMEEDSPVACLRATYFEGDTLSHRDFLGALMGAGVAREAVGDICVDRGSWISSLPGRSPLICFRILTPLDGPNSGFRRSPCVTRRSRNLK